MNDQTANVPPRPGASRLTVRGASKHPPVWDVALTIALGGALGALGRYAVASAWPHPAGGFPWATLAINATGCLLIGALMAVLTEVVGRPHRLVRPFLGVGVLGGFTTFSTYTVDTELLLTGGHPGLALAYLFGTLGAALVAVQLGIFAARFLTRHRTRPRRQGTPP